MNLIFTRLKDFFDTSRKILFELMFLNTVCIPLTKVDEDRTTVAEDALDYLNAGRIKLYPIAMLWFLTVIYEVRLETSTSLPCFVLEPTSKSKKITKIYWRIMLAIFLFGMITVEPSANISRVQIMGLAGAVLAFQALTAHFDQRHLPKQLKSTLDEFTAKETAQ
ncbi:hypothetical protein SAMN04487991_0533 [Celeribacter neptunius]|uniref:Uncharacterized protein n=2 Tax=Celeribacter neptunius TaxID=588602 RepID=A0A1I3K1E2_9RHOB|nr:hypothetical protein SAMN04487991_0533 [Celeribacter neptunius]